MTNQDIASSKLIIKENNMRNEKGFIEVVVGIVVVLLIAGFIFALFCVRFKTSQDNVSGIVYNTTNSAFISGNTRFCIRASENTYIYHNSDGSTNESCYCLPPHSPLIGLVNKAAQDKTIKVIVTANKYFALQAPWTCRANVVVTKEQQ